MPLNGGFEGGGTQFVEIEGAPIFRPAVGAALIFSGKNRHRGVETTRGVRYILAGFVDKREPRSPRLLDAPLGWAVLRGSTGKHLPATCSGHHH